MVAQRYAQVRKQLADARAATDKAEEENAVLSDRVQRYKQRAIHADLAAQKARGDADIATAKLAIAADAHKAEIQTLQADGLKSTASARLAIEDRDKLRDELVSCKLHFDAIVKSRDEEIARLQDRIKSLAQSPPSTAIPDPGAAAHTASLEARLDARGEEVLALQQEITKLRASVAAPNPQDADQHEQPGARATLQDEVARLRGQVTMMAADAIATQERLRSVLRRQDELLTDLAALQPTQPSGGPSAVDEKGVGAKLQEAQFKRARGTFAFVALRL